MSSDLLLARQQTFHQLGVLCLDLLDRSGHFLEGIVVVHGTQAILGAGLWEGEG